MKAWFTLVAEPFIWSILIYLRLTPHKSSIRSSFRLATNWLCEHQRREGHLFHLQKVEFNLHNVSVKKMVCDLSLTAVSQSAEINSSRMTWFWLTGTEHWDEWTWPDLKQNCCGFPLSWVSFQPKLKEATCILCAESLWNSSFQWSLLQTVLQCKSPAHMNIQFRP